MEEMIARNETPPHRVREYWDIVHEYKRGGEMEFLKTQKVLM